MVQKKANDLPIGQLVKLNSGAYYAPRWAEVTRHQKTEFGINTWAKVVGAPEEDLLGAETIIEGSETHHGIGWHTVSRLPS